MVQLIENVVFLQANTGTVAQWVGGLAIRHWNLISNQITKATNINLSPDRLDKGSLGSLS